VFITRALNAVAHLTEHSGEAFLQAVAAAPSDFSVLLRALEQSETTEQLRKEDPLLTARLRGIEAKQQLLKAEGGILSVEEVAKLLSISRQAVDKRRRSGQLIAVSPGRRGYAYPAWQFTENGTLPGLQTILQALRHHDEWMQIAFMLNANTRLKGRRPLDELRQGQVDAVVEAAKAYGAQGAA
jgi:biotin operon repressor